MEITVIFKIVAVGLITAVASLILKRAARDEIATVVSLVGLAIALVMMVDVIVQLFDTLRSLFGL